MMKRTFIALSAAALLSACGFTPVHAPAMSADAAAFKNVRIVTIESGDEIDREAAYLIKQRLRDRIGDNNGKHILEIKPRIRRARLGISGDDIATRYNVSVSADYKLIDAASGDTLDRGRVSTISSFGAPADPYGRVTAEKNATRTVSAETADRLLLKLASYYSHNKTP